MLDLVETAVVMMLVAVFVSMFMLMLMFVFMAVIMLMLMFVLMGMFVRMPVRMGMHFLRFLFSVDQNGKMRPAVPAFFAEFSFEANAGN